jgi:phosphate transport system protein
MKRFFHTELEAFRSSLMLMAEKALELSRQATRALLEKDLDMAKLVLQRDDEIDRLEMAIDNEAIRYLSLRSPVGRELRLLTVGMKTSRELERVGDEACTIAKRVIQIDRSMPVRDFLHIPQMSHEALEMLRDASNSLLEGDVLLAREIPIRDKKIDIMTRENYEFLIEIMMKEPEKVPSSLDLVFITKSIERIADHATNIAEEVVFLMNAEDVRHSLHTREVKSSV